MTVKLPTGHRLLRTDFDYEIPGQTNQKGERVH